MSGARPTSADVAKAAKVSRATVSYVLNGRNDVRITDATRQRVLAVARQLGYQPSPAARALRAGHGEVVLVLVPAWGAGQFADLFSVLGTLVGQHGLVCLRHEGPEWEGNLAQLLSRVTAAAVITLEPLDAADAATVERAGIPELRLSWLDQPGEPHSTAIDQVEVVRLQVEHLLEQGYRRLAYLALPAPNSRPFLQVRLQAFEDVCRSHGFHRAPMAVEAQDLQAVVSRIRSWYRMSGEPLGVCAWSDLSGLAALHAARSLDLDVPGDLGVIGVDDTPGASLSVPSLSSVRLDLTQEATLLAYRVAMAMGIEDEHPPLPGKPMTVVPRSSTQLDAAS
ncbi:LacI family DNA-binding transcriptional regulator [Nocardioides sp. NPDC051685]|uniref:LacI family DNA-binding transcriptional regulator n=1 Tax=Nocardioides sp. NPDC051685 TaxID=3364334 RepID=UPI0037BB900B